MYTYIYIYIYIFADPSGVLDPKPSDFSACCLLFSYLSLLRYSLAGPGAPKFVPSEEDQRNINDCRAPFGASRTAETFLFWQEIGLVGNLFALLRALGALPGPILL